MPLSLGYHAESIFGKATMEDLALDRVLPSTAYERLKGDILRGAYRPGEKLLMSALKARYALGTGPMREVLAQLVAQRLVVAINQKGYRVASMSLAEMKDIYEARARLEALMVTIAVERGDDGWEALIIAHEHTLAKVVEVRTPDEMVDIWDSRHKAFHNAIASGCKSKSLMQARAYLFDQAERYRQIWLKRTVLSEEALQIKREEHSRLIKALLSRDAEKSSNLMFAHLMTPVPIIAKIIEEEADSL